jgi:uncharacterized protein YecA (UPF0149 family)
MLTDAPSEPLTEEEEAELERLLQQSESVSLPYARGVFSAIACEHSLQDPSDWLGLVLGGQVADQHVLQRVFTLLLRDRFATAQYLQLGEPYTPEPEEHQRVMQFCKGFVRATRESPAWQNDVDAIGLSLPLAVLAGYLKLDSLRKVHPKLDVDEQAWRKEQRLGVSQRLLEIYEHFAETRQKQHDEAAEARKAEGSPKAEKVGRNEDCPCGSGSKYKKCCGRQT